MSAYYKAFNTLKGPVTHLKNIVSSAIGKKGKVSPTIKSVKPNVPTTKKEKTLSKLAIAKQKTKASGAKLKQTLFNIKQSVKGDK
jgi:hypothetical protein